MPSGIASFFPELVSRLGQIFIPSIVTQKMHAPKPGEGRIKI